MNAILLKDERSELEAFSEAILKAYGTSICREEEIIRNKREANHRKWEAKLRRANGCDDQVDDDAWLNKEPILGETGAGSVPGRQGTQRASSDNLLVLGRSISYPDIVIA